MSLQVDEIAGSAPFHVGGSVLLLQPVTVSFKHPETLQEGSVDFPCPESESGGQALQPLLDCCVPASFGRGQRAVLDPTYRQALCLPADKLTANLIVPPAEVMEDIHKVLQPAASSIKAELHKLNIYGPDGFFKSHVDTPHSPDMFGSLVVCLPTPFTGGELVLRGPGRKKARYKWGSGVSDNILHWAAFYSDVEHEILPVTTGYRVTLTYNLFHTAAAGPHSMMPTTESQKEISFSASLTQRLKDSTWHPDGAILGFALDHKYATGSGMPADIMPYMLKGSDFLLHEIVTRLGLRAKLIPIVRARYTYQPWDREQREQPKFVLGRSFGEHLQWQSASCYQSRATGATRAYHWPDASAVPPYCSDSQASHRDSGTSQPEAEGSTKQPAETEKPEADRGADAGQDEHSSSDGWGSESAKDSSDIDHSDDDEDPKERLRRLIEHYDQGSKWYYDDSSAASERNFLSVRHGTRNLPDLVWCKPPSSKHWLYEDEVDTWGNEPSVETWYVAAALLVKLPKYGVGVRAAV